MPVLAETAEHTGIDFVLQQLAAIELNAGDQMDAACNGCSKCAHEG